MNKMNTNLRTVNVITSNINDNMDIVETNNINENIWSDYQKKLMSGKSNEYKIDMTFTENIYKNYMVIITKLFKIISSEQIENNLMEYYFQNTNDIDILKLISRVKETSNELAFKTDLDAKLIYLAVDKVKEPYHGVLMKLMNYLCMTKGNTSPFQIMSQHLNGNKEVVLSSMFKCIRNNNTVKDHIINR